MPPLPRVRSAPTDEKGVPGIASTGFGGLLPWTSFIDDREHAPDVQWPQSVLTYAKMQTDAQAKGLLLATTLPIRRYRWDLEPNGAKPDVVQHVATDLNLPIRGQDPPPRRVTGRFIHDRHLQHALRALPFGHFYFEQVYRYDAPAGGGDGLLHLQKLGTRPPRTIANILVDDHGALKGIQQNIGIKPNMTQPTLDVNRLVAYIWDSDDDGDWVGRSMLRACFRHWLIKDRLLRVDATKHERNGMGMPWFEVDPAASKTQIDDLAAIASAMRAGEQSGGAGPGKLHLKGVEGTVPDTIGSVRYHDEQMAKAFILLFFNLGTSQTGSRALGSEFIDWYADAQLAIADWYRDRTQEDVVERLVALNWGEDEQPPLLSYSRLESAELSIADLSVAVDKGLIAVDDEMASYISQRWQVPDGAIKAVDNTPPPAPVPPAPAPAPGDVVPAPNPADQPPQARERSGGRRPQRHEVSAADVTIELPDRDLRRQPYQHEVEARVNFAAIDAVAVDGTAALVAAYRDAQAEQITALAGAVEAAGGDAAALATLEVDPVDPALIEGHLATAAESGVRTAQAERRAQLVASAAVRAAAANLDGNNPNQDAIDTEVSNRANAVAVTLAVGLGLAASKRASAVASLPPADAADDVRTYLSGLSDAELNLQLGGATWAGVNAGRRGFMSANNPAKVYASELLDGNTCGPCMSEDGTEWDTVAAAQGSYPSGGYVFCEGGLRCRGTLVAEY